MNNINDFIAAIQNTKSSGGSLDSLLQDAIVLASSGKTALGLNRWVDTDKPKMEDFNRDNEILDREISALKSNNVSQNHNQSYPTQSVKNFNDLPNGYCRVNEQNGSMQNSPIAGGFNGEVLTLNDLFGLITQKATPANNATVFRRTHNGSAWSSWVAEATAISPTKNNIPLNSGYSPTSASYFSKTQDGVLHVVMNVIHSADIVGGAYVATLPLGHLPTADTIVPCIMGASDGGSIGVGQLNISSSNGSIQVWPAVTARRILANFSIVV